MFKYCVRRAIAVRSVLLAGVCALAIAGAAAAQESKHDFNIPAQPAADSLQDFAKQSGMQVLFPYDAVQGKQAPAIFGNLDDNDVLQRLVTAGGLVVISNDGKTITLKADGPRTSNGSAQLGEILVTARRRGEAISKTPMTVTAITGDQLVKAGVVNANQLQWVAPSLVVSQGRQGVQFTLRGISTYDTSPKGQADVAFNIDGVPNLRSEEQGLAFFDLARVEVLNGPQSTLYGIASTAGSVNVITNPPTWTKAAGVTLEVGNYNTRRVQAMVNAPVNDILAFRAAISDNQRSGYVKLIGGESGNDPAAEDNFSHRVALLARFNSDFTVRLTETGGNLGGEGQDDSVPISVSGTGRVLIGHVSAIGYENPFTGNVNDNWEMPTLLADDAVGPVHLSLLSSYNYYHEDATTPAYYQNNDGNRAWIRERFQTYFNELRVSNQNPDDRVQYIAGVNYLWEQNNEDGHLFDINYNVPPAVNPDYATTDEPINTTKETSFSGFIHTITKITPDLRLTLGVRESDDTTSRVGTFAIGATDFLTSNFATGDILGWPNPQGGQCTGTQDCVGVGDSGSQRSTAFTYNAGLDYQITPTEMVYASVARGYKPGGFNDPNPGLNNGTAPYGPEHLNAYEIGYKLSTPEGWRLSSDFFYYDFSAEQIDETAEFNGNPELFILLKPTKEYGSENSLTIPVTPADQLTLTATFLHGTFSAGNGAITGWTLSNMPAAVVGASYVHSWDLGDGGVINFHADTRWSDHYYENDIGNLLQYEQPSFTRSDADISYVTPNGNFTTQAFVNNIENKVQFTTAGESTSGETSTVNGSITTPRFYGLREIVKF